jgi:diadenosine tetraphosphatase ApaH/serine/threonine PP2A family protein phosphatase
MEALESVFRDIEKQGVEKIHFLGDAVGYGSNPNKCIQKIDKYCEIKLLGNHDYALMGLESTKSFNHAAKASIEWTKSNIKKKNITLLADFEMEATFLDYYMVHSSPGHAERWFYILDLDQATQSFDNFSQNVCFVGHSHIPAIFKKDKNGETVHQIKESIEVNGDCKYIINVGSVGQPRDNDSRACYLIADISNGILYYRRVEYDIKKTQKNMRKANLPEFLIDRLAIGV